MTDTLTRKERSAHMARIRGKRTKPEMLVHGILKGHKVPHRMWPDWIEGHPDVVVFGDPDVVVFVNGCFWHGCRAHFKMPKTNVSFWFDKIERNRERQAQVTRRLRRGGYRVAVLWEHDLARGLGITRAAAAVKRRIIDG